MAQAFFWACYVKIKQVASKEVELIKLGFLQGFFWGGPLYMPLNAVSPVSSCLPYTQLSPTSPMLSYTLCPLATILAHHLVPLYSLITSEVKSNTMLWI